MVLPDMFLQLLIQLGAKHDDADAHFVGDGGEGVALATR